MFNFESSSLSWVRVARADERRNSRRDEGALCRLALLNVGAGLDDTRLETSGTADGTAGADAAGIIDRIIETACAAWAVRDTADAGIARALCQGWHRRCQTAYQRQDEKRRFAGHRSRPPQTPKPVSAELRGRVFVVFVIPFRGQVAPRLGHLQQARFITGFFGLGCERNALLGVLQILIDRRHAQQPRRIFSATTCRNICSTNYMLAYPS
jgi:hypothetical protein